jgi:hypothetical protein
MEISTSMICNWAEVREGVLFVAGGGITRAWKPQFPAPLGVCFAVVLSGTQGEMIGIPHDVEMVVSDADGQELARLTGALQTAGNTELQPGETLQLPLAFNLTMLPIPAAGAYDLRVSVDRGAVAGQPERIMTIYAMQMPAQPPPAEA